MRAPYRVTYFIFAKLLAVWSFAERSIVPKNCAHGLRMLARFTRRRNVDHEADEVLKLSGHSSVVHQSISLPFPFANRIVTFTTDGTVRIFSTQRGECLHCLAVHDSRPGLSALASLGGDVFAISSPFDGLISTWGSGAGERLGSLVTGDGQNIRCITSQDSSNFIAGTQDGSILLFAHSDGREIMETGRATAAHESCIACLASTKRTLYSASYDRTVTAWDIVTLQRIDVLRNSSSAIFCVDASEAFLVTGSYGKSIRVYSISGKQYDLVGTYGSIHSGPVCSVTLLGKDFILSSSADETICITELQSGFILARIRIPFSPITASVISDGRLLATGHGGNAYVITPPSTVSGLLQVYATSKQPLPMQKARADVLSGSISASSACASLSPVDQVSCIGSLDEWKAVHELAMLSNRDSAGGTQLATECDGKRNWWLLTLHCLATQLIEDGESLATSFSTKTDSKISTREQDSNSGPSTGTPWSISNWSEDVEETGNFSPFVKRLDEPLSFLLASKRWVEERSLIQSTSRRIRALASDLAVGSGSKEDLLKRAKAIYDSCSKSLSLGKQKDGDENNNVSPATQVKLAKLYFYIIVIVSGARGCGFSRAIGFLLNYLGRSSTDGDGPKSPGTKSLPPPSFLHSIFVEATTMFSEHALSDLSKCEAQNLNDVTRSLQIDAAKDFYRLYMSAGVSGNAGGNGDFDSDSFRSDAPGSLVTPQDSLHGGDSDSSAGGKKKARETADRALQMLGRSNLSPARRLVELEVAGVNAHAVSTMSREILSSAVAAFVLSYDQRLAHKFGPLERCIFEVFVENDITAEVLSDEYAVSADDFCEVVVAGMKKDPDVDATIGSKVRVRQFYARAVMDTASGGL